MRTKMLDFKEVLAYLQKKFPKISITSHSLRVEMRNYPERFGAVRRNPTTRRGRGGKFLCSQSVLAKYQPFDVWN